MSAPITCDQLLPLLHDHNAFAAIELIQSDPNPLTVAERYDKLIPELYWKHKNLPAVTFLSQAAILFCLAHMPLATDPGHRTTFGHIAKGRAYDLASFTWPGWDEPGILITPADLTLGISAAKLNLRLALDLHRPADRIADAHWLLGAWHLVMKNPAAALSEFQQSLEGTHSPSLMQGYIELARILLHEPNAPTTFTTLLTALAEKSDKDSRFIHTQLTTAHRIFTKISR